jgi:capsular polysaccharide biosynthesis protein
MRLTTNVLLVSGNLQTDSFMGKILHAAMAHVYRYVKQHKQLRAIAVSAWTNFSKTQIAARRILTGEKNIPGPCGHITVKKWINQQGTASNAHLTPHYTPVYPASTVVRDAPITLDGSVHWRHREKQTMEYEEAFVASIPQGRAWDQGFCITPDNLLLGDVSRIIEKNLHVKDSSTHPVLSMKELPQPRKIKGRVAVIATQAGRGYYHWMYDALPRLHLLKKAGIDFNSIDKFFVNECVAAFHFATLEAAGIPQNKLIQCRWTPHIQADDLIIPSHVGELAAMPRWACNFLREILPPNPSDPAIGHPEKIYIKRAQNTHRKVTNEPEIVDMLGKMGFVAIDPEDYSMQQQASLFSTARVIVSPHGSGLVNVAFCEPDTRVVEFFHPAALSLMFWSLCADMGAKYYCLFGEGEHPKEGVDIHRNNLDITINLAELRRIVEKAIEGA